jgi:hypothetical protein
MLATVATPPATSVATVRYSGPITEQDAARLVPMLRASRTGALKISSFGGSETAAIAIGEIVKQRRLTVIVDGVCMSACAQYILLPAERSQITAGSLIGFHSSSYALHQWSRRHAHGRDRYAELAAETAAVSSQSERLLTRPGQLRFLEQNFAALRPLCLAPRADSKAQSRIKLGAPYLIPSAAALGRLGISVPGGWPRSLSEARTYASRFMRDERAFAFGDPAALPAVQTIPVCREG